FVKSTIPKQRGPSSNDYIGDLRVVSWAVWRLGSASARKGPSGGSIGGRLPDLGVRGVRGQAGGEGPLRRRGRRPHLLDRPACLERPSRPRGQTILDRAGLR